MTRVAQHLPTCWCQQPEYPFGHLMVGRFSGTAHWGRTAGIVALRHTLKQNFDGKTEAVTEVLLVRRENKQLDFPKRKRSRIQAELAHEVASRAWFEETGLPSDHLNFLMPVHVFVDTDSGCHYFPARWEGGPGCPPLWSPWSARAAKNKPTAVLQWTPIREAQSSAELSKPQRMILISAEEECHKTPFPNPGVAIPDYIPILWQPLHDTFCKTLCKPRFETEGIFPEDDQTTTHGAPSSSRSGCTDETVETQSVEQPSQAGVEVLMLLTRAPAVLLGNKHDCETVSTLLKQGKTADKSGIIRWICQDMLSLAEDEHACHVVQDLLGSGISTDDASFLVAHIFPHTQRLLESKHGNYVLTKAVEVAASNEIEHGIDCIRRMGIVDVAKHRFGCRLFERLIENHAEHEVVARLLDELSERACEMHKHRYSNYVLQSLVEHGPTNSKKNLFTKLMPEVPGMAIHRFASHLAQKMFQFGDPNDRLQIATALIQADVPQFAQIAADRFGKFVVNEMLHVLSTEDEIPEEQRIALGVLVRVKLDEAAKELPELAETHALQTVISVLDELR
eukprot:CAMPEP_0115600362 /NCGR_PEP_ID=MMETSP0272-20121206/14854_1 /TAXON_ID=71861 /ORGANISM="Scrippsiella trochoidea, Strain CCMP3099" /LENGTH=564 /DNA_ID=CAMNT_0003035813 /DNA_START=9 /DNA_END=1700 /DNA_ORIENTATION=+